MNRTMLYRHRRNRRRFLAALWVMLVLTHFVVFIAGGLRGYSIGAANALNAAEQETRRTFEEKAGIRKNVRDRGNASSGRQLSF